MPNSHNVMPTEPKFLTEEWARNLLALYNNGRDVVERTDHLRPDEPKKIFVDVEVAVQALMEVCARVRGLAADLSESKHALDELVKLQAHYARLLNQYDGGKRRAFVDAVSWLARLRETGGWDDQEEKA